MIHFEEPGLKKEFQNFEEPGLKEFLNFEEPHHKTKFHAGGCPRIALIFYGESKSYGFVILEYMDYA